MIPFSERVSTPHTRDENEARQRAINFRVACPGIILSFDPSEQTVSVQLALREQRVDNEGNKTWIEIPQLVDVPVVFPRAGGYVLTMPIQEGDECLVIFGDMCMDAWWQSGGVQNQIDCRRHDLSDGFAILGPWSQPQVIPNYSTSTAQFRTVDGSSYVELAGSNINIVASGNINIKGATVNINS